MARLRRIWLLISLAGSALTVVGIVGLVAHWGTTHAVAHPAATPAVVSSAVKSTAVNRSLTPTQAQPESPAAFFALFSAAVRTGDTSFLAARVDPAVIARYGAAQCQTALGSLHDPTEQLRLVSTSGPVQYAYVSDGMSATVPDTYVFHVDGTAAGQSGPRAYHFALEHGTFHLFLDCGTPLH